MEKYIKKINELLDKIDNSEAEQKLRELREDIIYDLALKDSKGSKKEQLRYAKQLLADAKKNKRPSLIQMMYKIDDTYQLTDGYVGVVLNEKIEGLELNTAEEEYLDCRRVIDKSDFRYNLNYKKVDINLETLTQQAIGMKNTKVEIYIGETYFKPMNLLRAIKILGTDNVEVYFNTKGENNIYLESPLGRAVVLVTKRKNAEIKEV